MKENGFLGQLLKKKWMITIVVAILVCAVVIGVVVALNVDMPFKTSDNDAVLSTRLGDEETEVINAFSRRFQFLGEQYSIDRVILLGEGEYAAVLLELDSAKYRAVLENKDNEWVVIGVPAVVLYYEDFMEVPRDIIRAANNLGVKNNE